MQDNKDIIKYIQSFRYSKQKADKEEEHRIIKNKEGISSTEENIKKDLPYTIRARTKMDEHCSTFKEYCDQRSDNRVATCRIKSILGKRPRDKKTEKTIKRVAQYGYSKRTLLGMYGLDTESHSKKWLQKSLGWNIQDPWTLTSLYDSRVCGKHDGWVTLHDLTYQIEIKCPINESDVSIFDSSDLPQIMANLSCELSSSIAGTLYVRFHPMLCCIWFIPWSQDYWNRLHSDKLDSFLCDPSSFRIFDDFKQTISKEKILRADSNGVIWYTLYPSRYISSTLLISPYFRLI